MAFGTGVKAIARLPYLYTMNKRKKRCYPAGAISLILLPICFIFYGQKAGLFREYRMIEVFRITRDFYEPQQHKAIVFVRPPERHDLAVVLTGRDDSARTQLAFAADFLRQIRDDQDTTRGVHFKFTPQAKYWMFVRALDICNTLKLQHFVTLDNNIRAYFIAPERIDSNNTIFAFSFCGFDDGWREEIAKEKVAAQQQAYTTLLYDLWPVWLLFAVLVGFAGFNVMKFNGSHWFIRIKNGIFASK